MYDEEKASKIEALIKHNLEIAKEESLNRIKETCNMQIDRINGVYTSMLNTLKTLELKDSSLLDLFEKSNGNIRVINYNPIPNYLGGLWDVNFPYNNMDYYKNNPIRLKDNTKYKLIMIAIEQKEDKQ